MTNNNRPDISKMTRAERLAYFSSAKEEMVMLPTRARRLPPKSRRTSVRHRAIR